MSPFSDKNLISTKEASEISGYNSDYLARLCRSGKISGTQLGRSWLVSQESLEEFVKAQGTRKQELWEQLSEEREKEYKQAQIDSASNHVAEAVAPFASIGLRSPLTSNFQKKAFALIASLVVMLGISSVVEAAPLAAIEKNSVATAENISNGFNAITGDAFANALGAENKNHAIAISIPANVTSPAAAVVALGEGAASAYTTVGEVGYSAIVDGLSMDAYAAEHPGEVIVALGGVPANVTSEILNTYADGVQGWVNTTPEVPLAITEGTLDTGSAIGEVAANVPQVAVATFTKSVQGTGTVTGSIAFDAAQHLVTLPAQAEDTELGFLGNSDVDLNTAVARAPVAALAAADVVYGPALKDTTFAASQLAAAIIPAHLSPGEKFALNTYYTINNFLFNASTQIASLFGVSAPSLNPEPTTYAISTSTTAAPYTTPETVSFTTTTRGSDGYLGNSNGGSGTAGVPQVAYAGVSQAYVDSSVAALRELVLEQVEAATQGGHGGGGGGGGLSEADIQSLTGTSITDASIASSTIASSTIANSTFTGGSISTGDLTAGSTTVDSLAVNGDESVGGNVVIGGTISASNFNASGTLSSANGTFTNATITNATSTNLYAANGYVSNLTSDSASTTNLVATNANIVTATINNFISTVATIAGLTSTNSTSTNASTTNFYASNGVINSLLAMIGNFTTLIADSFTANSATIGDLTGTNATTTNATSTNLYATNANVANLTGTNANVTNLTSANASTTNGYVSQLSSDNANLTNANLTNVTIAQATSTDFFASLAHIVNGTFDNFTSTLATIAGLTTTNATSTNATSTNLYATNANVTNLAIGNLNGVLHATNGLITSGQVDLTTDVTNVLPTTNGGTGFNSYAPGIVLVTDGGGNLIQLSPGNADQVLKINGSGVPYWGVDETVGSGGSDGIFATSSNEIYPLDTSNIFLIGTNATSSKNSMFEVHGNSYFGNGNVGIGSTSATYQLSVEGISSLGNHAIAGNFISTTTNVNVFPNASTTNLSIGSNTGFSLGNVNGLLFGNNGAISALATSTLNIAVANLVGTTDNLAEGTSHLYFTNARADARIDATTTLGQLTSAPNLGTVSTSLNGFLKATAGALSTSLINLTSDVTGTLPVANGGTGTSSFATNGLLYGNGTNNLLNTGQGGANTVLVANNGAPMFSSAITVGTSVTTPTINATTAIQLNGTNINTAGTLSNVAYQNQSNNFTGNTTFTNATSTSAYTSQLGVGIGTNGSNYFTTLLGNGLTNINGALSVATSSLASGFFQQGGNSFGTNENLGTNDAYNLNFETNGSTRATLQQGTGYFGIGTTSPSAALAVNGGAFISGTETVGGLIDNSETTNSLIYSNATKQNASATIGAGLNFSAGTLSNTGVLSFNGRNGAVVPVGGDYNTSQVTESGNLYFTNARAQAAVGATYPVVDTGGIFSLAFGTTTANSFSALQQFNGGFTATNATTTSLYASTFGLGGSYYTSLLGPGLADINGVLSSTYATTSLATNFFQQGGNSFGTTANIGTNDAYNLNFETNGSTRATLQQGTGYFGIGTTSPGANLAVNGAAIITGNVNAGSLTTSGNVNAGSLTIGTLNGFLKATAGVVSTSLINLASDVTGTLPVANGGTGSTTLTGILKGNGTGGIQTALAGTDYLAPSSLSSGSGINYNAGTGVIANTGVLSFNSRTGAVLPMSGDYNTSQVTESGNLYFTTARAQAAVGAAYPIVDTSGIFSLAFGTTTPNSYSALQQFNGGASTTQLTVTGPSYLAKVTETNATSTSEYTSMFGLGTDGYYTSLLGPGLANVNGVLSSTLATSSLATNFFQQGGNSFGAIANLGTNDNYNLNFETGGTTHATINYSTGYFGIGTTSPGATLAVNGAGLFSGTVTVGNLINAGVTANSLLYVNGAQQESAATIGTGLNFSTGTLSNTGVLSFNSRTGAVVPMTGDYNTSQVTESGNLYFTTARAQAAVGATYPIIDTAGNFSLAFGTTTPNSYSQLQQFNRGFVATNATTTNATSTSEYTSMFGLGTDGYYTSLLGPGLTNINGVLSSSFATSSLATNFFQQGGNTFGGIANLGTNDNYNLNFETGGTTHATINYSTGYFGVGTTSPGSILSINNVANFTAATSTFYSAGGLNLTAGCYAVNGVCLGAGGGTVGTGTTGQFPYYAANGTALTATSSLFLATSGNVGVGTVSPDAPLNVVLTPTIPNATATNYGVDISDTPTENFSPVNSQNDTVTVENHSLSLNNLTLGASSVSNHLHGASMNANADAATLSGSPTFNITSGGIVSLNATGLSSTVQLTPALTAVAATGSKLNVYGANIQTSVGDSGNANLTQFVYGLALNTAGTITDTGASTITTGISDSVTGTSALTYGESIGVSGGVNSSDTAVGDLVNGINVGGIAVGFETTGVTSSNGGNAMAFEAQGAVSTSGTAYDFYGNDASALNYFAGNVGIGTTTPGSALSVSGNAFISATTTTAGLVLSNVSGLTAQCLQADAFGNVTGTGAACGAGGGSTTGTTGQVPYFASTNTLAATSTLFINSNGNVGVGTNAPLTKLDVVGTEDIRTGNTGSILQLLGDANATNGATIAETFATGAYGPIKFNVSGAEAMRINANGYVGIGTTSPSQALSVSGKGYFTGGVQFGDGTIQTTAATSGSNYFTNSGANTYLSTGTNLGIGTTTPYANLTIAGSFTAVPVVSMSSATTTVVYNASGANSFTVPSGTTSIQIKAWGAGGGSGSNVNSAAASGGAGGYAAEIVTVAAGNTVAVHVGGGGTLGVQSATVAGGYGYDSPGGTGGTGINNSGGGGGGGESDVQVNSTNVIIAAGGGGGVGYNVSDGGGAGGGTTGAGGGGGGGGGGGTSTSGGTSGAGAAGSAGGGGTSTSGGAGGNSSGSGYGGGGGGGGYYGGGGGGGNNGAGGGGSSYTYPSATSVTNTGGSGAVPPNTSDPSYQSNAGQGGGSTTAASNGNPGLVVISYLATVTSTTTPTSVIAGISNNSTQIASFLSNGNVGIGTTNPTATLTVAGNGLFSGSLSTSGLTVAGTTTLSSNVTLSGITGANQCLQVNSSGVISGTGSTCGSGGSGYSPVGTQGYFPYFSASNTLSATSTLFLATNGDLGIQNGTPIHQLGIGYSAGGEFISYNGAAGTPYVGAGYDPTADGFEIKTNIGSSDFTNSPFFVQRTTGYVGIGTTSPTQLLQVEKDQNALTELLTVNSTAGSGSSAADRVQNDVSQFGQVGIFSSTNAGAGAFAPGDSFVDGNTLGFDVGDTNASGVIKFITGGTTERARIDQYGNFMIGTTTSTSLLTVSSGATPTYLYPGDSALNLVAAQELYTSVIAPPVSSANQYANAEFDTQSNAPAGGNTSGVYSIFATAFDTATTTAAQNSIGGIAANAKHLGSDTLGTLYGGAFTANDRGIGLLTGEYGLTATANTNSGIGATSTGMYGVQGVVNNSSVYGGANVSAALDAVQQNNAANDLITNSYGLKVENLTNSAGTITNTYGVYVGTETAGTQTNTPYSFYASDPSALNYFAGNTGIGLTSTSTNAVDNTGFTIGKEGSNSARLTFDGAAHKYYITASSTADELQIGRRISSDSADGDVLDITGTGNVGIGTTTPLSTLALDVNGNLGSLSNTSNAGVYLGTGSGYGIIAAINAANTANQPLSLQPNGGNVGIGTTAPGSTLTVAGTGSFSGAVTTGGLTLSNLSGVTASCLQVNTSGVVSGSGTACGSGSGSYAPVGTTGQTLYFSSANTLSATSTLTVATNGNIGISTSTPYAALSVAGLGGTLFNVSSGGQFTTTVVTYFAGATFTKPANLDHIVVQVIGGGGGGGGGSGTSYGGAAGGTGGASSMTYNSGANTITANGGTGTRVGGTATGGDTNVTGASGTAHTTYPGGNGASSNIGANAAGAGGTMTGGGYAGGTGGGGAGAGGGGGGGTSYGGDGGGGGGVATKTIPASSLGATETVVVGGGGGGGGGGSTSVTAGSAGTSSGGGAGGSSGGAGGSTASSGTGGAGASQYGSPTAGTGYGGGGGAGANPSNGGAAGGGGAGGEVIITEYLLNTSGYANLFSINSAGLVTSAGSMAVGTTTTPGSTLGVAGNATIGADYLTGLAPTNGLLVEGNVGIGTSTPTNKLTLNGDSSTLNSSQILIDGATNPLQQMFIGYNTTGNYGYIQPILQGTAYENLALNLNGGNVGIGTTSPLSRFAVSGGETVGADYNIAAPTNGLLVEGNVGIGTTSPNASLDVFNNNYTGGNSLAVTGATDATILMRAGAGSVSIDTGLLSSGTGYIQDHSIGNFATNYPLAINPNGGNVGIGTTNPGATLAVAGTGIFTGNVTTGGLTLSNITGASASCLQVNTLGVVSGSGTACGSGSGSYAPVGGTGQSLYFSSTNTLTATSTLTIAANGNVGIGATSTPFAALSVAGVGSNLFNVSTGAPMTTTVLTYYKSATFTKPAGLDHIVVQVVGGGGGGAAIGTAGGAGGTSSMTYNSGANTITANGGGGGIASGGGGAGGAATGGDTNTTGATGSTYSGYNGAAGASTGIGSNAAGAGGSNSNNGTIGGAGGAGAGAGGGGAAGTASGYYGSSGGGAGGQATKSVPAASVGATETIVVGGGGGGGGAYSANGTAGSGTSGGAGGTGYSSNAGGAGGTAASTGTGGTGGGYGSVSGTAGTGMAGGGGGYGGSSYGAGGGGAAGGEVIVTEYISTGTAANLFSINSAGLVTSAGSMAVGTTTTPGSTLGVAGNATIGADYLTGLAPTNGLLVEGNVGIGTTTPDAKLTISANTSGGASVAALTGTNFHIEGTDSVPNRIVFDAFNSNSNLTFRRADGTAGAPSAVAANEILGNLVAFGYGTTGYSASGRAAVGFYAAQTWTDAAQGTYINFITTPLNSTAAVEAMRIDSTGNVGIGTTSPTSKLTINDTANGGNLLVQSSGTAAGEEFNDTSFGGRNFEIDSTGGTNATPSSFTINDDTAGQTRFMISQIGNVGIGTTTPSQQLTVAGTGYFGGGIQFGDGTIQTTAAVASANYFTNSGASTYLSTGTNLGIGTTTPAATLSVSGSGYVTNTLGVGMVNSVPVSGTVQALNGYVSGSYAGGLFVGYNGQLGIGNYGNGNIIGLSSTAGTATVNIANGLTVNTNSLVVNSSTGNVTVGGSSSVTKLDVVGPSGVTSFTGLTHLGLQVQGSTGTTDYSGIDFSGDSASAVNNRIASIGILSTSLGSSMSFGTSNSYASGVTNTALTIDPSGNVGIQGAANDSYALDVTGNTYATGVAGSNLYDYGATSALLYSTSGGLIQAATISSPLTYSLGTLSLGTVPIAKGGTNSTAFNTNGVTYYNGTSIVNSTALTYNGSSLINGTGTGQVLTLVNGGSSGTAGGGAYYVQNNGSSLGAFGNTSAIYGSAYSSTMTLYGATGLNLSTSFQNALSINSSGVVYVGGTTSGYTGALNVKYTGGSSEYGIVLQDGTDTTDPLIIENAAGSTIGSITSSASSVAYNTTSDRRLKQNIVPSTQGLSTLMEIPIDNFNFISDPTKTTQQGFIAQDLESIYPEAVSTNGDNGTVPLAAGITPWEVDYGRLTPLIIKSVQDLANNTTASTTALTLQINTLQSQVASSSAPTDLNVQTVVATGSITAGTVLNAATVTTSGGAAFGGTVTANDYQLSALMLSTGSTTPSSVLNSSGTMLTMAGLANYTLNSLNSLTAQTGALATQQNTFQTVLQSLTSRVVALENETGMSTSSLEAAVAGATASSTSSSSTDLATTTIVNALSDMGVLLEKGIAQFNTLVVRDLVFSKDSDGTSAAGSGTILTGNTTVQITNSHMLASSQVSVTLTSPMTGNWYVTNKQDGSFQVTVSAPQAQDVTFDYLIIQTQGQIATSTPVGATNSGAFSISSWLASLFGGSSTSSAPSGSTGTSPEQGTGSGTGSGSGDNGGTGNASSTPSTPNADAPVVTLTGAAAMSIDQGGVFTDPGATAKDAGGNDISSSIVETGTMDANTPGMYTLTYTATDANGNTGNASRVVTVAAAYVPPASSGSTDSGSSSTGSTSSTGSGSDASSASAGSSSSSGSDSSAPAAAPASTSAASTPAPSSAPASTPAAAPSSDSSGD